MAPYEHRQFGWGIAGITALVTLPIAGTFFWLGVIAPAIIVLLLPVTLAVLCGTLTVRVDDAALYARLGVGMIQRRVPLEDIVAYRIVRQPWYCGFGWRLLADGELLNVSGLSAVELKFRSGRRLRVGTDEPDKLFAALSTVLSSRPEPLSEPKGDDPYPHSIPKIAAVVPFAVVGLFLALVAVNSGQTSATVTADALTVKSGWRTTTIPRSTIRGVEIRKEIPRVMRKLNAYWLGSTLRGRFRLEQWGDGDVYAELDKPPFVVVHTRDRFVVLGLSGQTDAERLYRELGY